MSLMESGEQLEMMEGLDAAEVRKIVDMFADIGFAEVQSLTTPDLDKVTSEAAEVLRQTSLEPGERAKDSEAAKWLKKFAQEKQRKLEKTAHEFRQQAKTVFKPQKPGNARDPSSTEMKNAMRRQLLTKLHGMTFSERQAFAAKMSTKEG